jgi:cell division protein ZapA
MGEISIKIRIAEREYPMKVALEDEQRLRVAGKLINEKLKSFKDSFGIDDKQDLLAMVAFDIAVDMLKSDEANTKVKDTVENTLKQLNQMIDNSLTH